MGTSRRSLGALFVSADWRVRVFWSSCLLDILSNRLYVSTITLSGCMDRRSCFMLLFYKPIRGSSGAMHFCMFLSMVDALLLRST